MQGDDNDLGRALKDRSATSDLVGTKSAKTNHINAYPQMHDKSPEVLSVLMSQTDSIDNLKRTLKKDNGEAYANPQCQPESVDEIFFQKDTDVFAVHNARVSPFGFIERQFFTQRLSRKLSLYK
ncbi:MAG: hypothetical protein JWP09_865 [Candidatus Taylorbacteria bacterium]|nr:hypothetical protein [Candidatus Taylorbacteria bacterium]